MLASNVSEGGFWSSGIPIGSLMTVSLGHLCHCVWVTRNSDTGSLVAVSLGHMWQLTL